MFWDRVSPSCPDWPWTPFRAQEDLEFVTCCLSFQVAAIINLCHWAQFVWLFLLYQVNYLLIVMNFNGFKTLFLILKQRDETEVWSLGRKARPWATAWSWKQWEHRNFFLLCSSADLDPLASTWSYIFLSSWLCKFLWLSTGTLPSK